MRFITKLSLLVVIISGCAPIVSRQDILPAPIPQEYQDFGYYLAWSPDDKLLAVTTNTGLYVYDAHTFEQLASFPGLSGSTVTFASEYMSAINSDGMYVWSLKDYSLLFQEKSTDPIQFQSISISPNGQWLVTGEQKQLRLWKLPSGEVVAKLPVDGFVSNLAFTAEKTLIVIEQYRALIREWDPQKQEVIRSFEIPRDVLFFTLSEDGNVMFVDYGEAGVEMWNVETGEPTHYYQQMQGASGWARLSGDNQTGIVWGYAIDGDNSGMGIWDLVEDKRVYEVSTPFVKGDGWRSGALNSDGTVLAASNNEGFIYFYDLESGKKIGEIYLPYRFTA